MREAQAQDWLADLGEFDPKIVAEACARWRRANPDKRPGPGHIRLFCIEELNDRRLALPPPDPWPAWLAEIYGPEPEGPIRRQQELQVYEQRLSRVPVNPVPDVAGFKVVKRDLSPIAPGEVDHLINILKRGEPGRAA